MDNNNQDKDHEPHPDFVTGFNMGYVLAEHEPEMALQIADKIDFTSERSVGFKCGIAQYAMEKDKSFQPDWDKSKETKNEHEKSKDKEPDRDDLEYQPE